MADVGQTYFTTTAVCANPIADIYVHCGFTPSRIEVVNPAKAVKMTYYSGMTAGYGLKETNGAMALITSLGITPYAGGDRTVGGVTSKYAPGFIIGQDTDLQVAGDTLYITAFY